MRVQGYNVHIREGMQSVRVFKVRVCRVRSAVCEGARLHVREGMKSMNTGVWVCR